MIVYPADHLIARSAEEATIVDGPIVPVIHDERFLHATDEATMLLLALERVQLLHRETVPTLVMLARLPVPILVAVVALSRTLAALVHETEGRFRQVPEAG
jgi:hypothetical protein